MMKMSKETEWVPSAWWTEMFSVPAKSGITKGKPKPKNV